MSRFAAWWRVRSAVRLNVTRQGDQFMVATDGLPPDWRLGIEYWRGKHVALMPLDAPAVWFAPKALAYENRGERLSVYPVRIDQSEGVKAHIRRMIDWERVTPVEEIAGGGWRNTAKRTLRKWWKKSA